MDPAEQPRKMIIFGRNYRTSREYYRSSPGQVVHYRSREFRFTSSASYNIDVSYKQTTEEHTDQHKEAQKEASDEPQKTVVLLKKPQNTSLSANIESTSDVGRRRSLTESNVGECSIQVTAPTSSLSVQLSPKPSAVLSGSSKQTMPVPNSDKGCENEAKKVLEDTLMKPNMVSPQKLISRNLILSDKPLRYLSESNTNYKVISCLGYHSTGKSTILNCFATNNGTIFPTASDDFSTKSKHTTEGIDMYITQDRTILLDVQPLFSASMFIEALDAEKRFYQNRNFGSNDDPKTTPCTSFDGEFGKLQSDSAFTVQSLQLAVFVLAISHTVFFIDDTSVDLDVANVLHALEILKPTTPTSAPTEQQTVVNGQRNRNHLSKMHQHKEYYPHLVILQNRCDTEMMHEEMQNEIRLVYSTLLQNTSFNFWDGIQNKIVKEMNQSIETGAKESNDKDEPNVYFLPLYNKESNKPDFINRWLYEAKYLVNKVKSIQNEPLVGVPLTEKQWFLYAQKLWESVKRSTLITDYQQMLKNETYYG